jgi:sec-independent protein translocase protein TatA
MGPGRFRIVMNILALGIGNLGGPDLFIILLIVLVLFGAKKLPDLARSLGQSMNEFRKAREDIDRELHNTGAQPSQPQPCHSTQQVAAAPGPASDVGSASPVGDVRRNEKFTLRKS